ncbi:ion transporter [Pontiella desulfatans]|nr:ion transporter [Pontiella desulfatans]
MKKRLRRVLFENNTPGGRAFDILLFIAIVVSVGLTMLDSVKSIHAAHGALLFALNSLFSILFTIEYALRLYSAPKRTRYAHSFFGVVDLLAILPFYVGMIIPGTRVLDVIRVLRVLRIFRVLKMAQYVNESDLLLNALVASRRKIGIFFVAVLTIVTIIGSLMYIIEGEANGFTSIPKSVYWAIVTLTTVGYGDISPQTNLGQFLSSLIMVVGYSIIAVPTGIITADIVIARSRQERTCQACGQGGNENDARHCKHCGARL